MHKTNLSKQEFKKFLITYHGLNSFVDNNNGQGIMNYMQKVGCIQYDPLNVVGRNPDLVLQSRIKDYRSEMLDDLLYSKRELVDGWDKMMAIYPTTDWPHFSRVRAERILAVEKELKLRNSSESLEHVEHVKAFIQENGASMSSHIQLGTTKKGSWGHSRLSGAVMDYLFHGGILGVARKVNTQKVYDLIERLIPEDILQNTEHFESDMDFYKWYFKRRIGSIGIYWDRNGGGWLGTFLSDKKLRMQILSELQEEGEIIPVSVEDMKENFYIRKEDLTLLENLPTNTEKKVSFLAPLDNLLWDRKLIKDIFQFEYSWEVYVPAAKRRYGYYVLPVLYGDQFIARFEPEMHRGHEPLKIKNWWWEEHAESTPEMQEAILSCFDEFCRYLGADGLQGNF